MCMDDIILYWFLRIVLLYRLYLLFCKSVVGVVAKSSKIPQQEKFAPVDFPPTELSSHLISRVLERYPKKVSQILTLSAIDRLLAANIVEQNIGQHLSEPEFHSESNDSSLIPPN